jgi:hypothetical protein
VEEYSAWMFLKDKWPLALVLGVVLLTIFIFTTLNARAQKKKKAHDSEKTQ